MRNRINRQKSGFTLIELLVVVVIIGILTGIVAGVASLASRKSADADTRAKMQFIADALEEYRIEYGSYPFQLSDLKNAGTNIQPQYKEFNESDNWGTPYEYDVDGLTYTLVSRGPDRVTGTSDDIDLGSKSY